MGDSIMRTARWFFLIATSIIFLVILSAPRLQAFTQRGGNLGTGNYVPMGHEWITRLAGLEVIGGDPLPPDPDDPRNKPSWGTKGRAKNADVSSAKDEVTRIKASPTDENEYKSTYDAVLSAIVGQRWVDIGGFNVSKSKLDPIVNCWDGVAQQPAEVQYDHFMRRFDDADGKGGVNAATKSQRRFVDYFVAAATAPPARMVVYDGGGTSATTEVDRNYFLFGRAVHLFQDSFSPEHTVRLSKDMYESVRQVKSYLCALGSEQHSHSSPAPGDIIWIAGTAYKTGWSSYKASFMKTLPLVATEGSRDLWAAFIRTMATAAESREAIARTEANTLVANWLNFNADETLAWYDDEGHRDDTYVLGSQQSGVGRKQAICVNALPHAPSDRQADMVAQLVKDQRKCIFNIEPVAGYEDLFDPALHIAYNWQWAHALYQTPPSDWSIPTRPADKGTKMNIKSAANNQCLTAPEGLRNGSIVHAAAGQPLELIFVGDTDPFGPVERSGHLRARFAPKLFVSYESKSRKMKLWDGTNESRYKIDRVGDGVVYSIFNFAKKEYFWLDGDVPTLNAKGKPANQNAQWTWGAPGTLNCSR
jgi:hypothetical protein